MCVRLLTNKQIKRLNDRQIKKVLKKNYSTFCILEREKAMRADLRRIFGSSEDDVT